MQNAKLFVNNLSVGYKKPLIQDICFNLKAGEIMTLIGPNGAGKSTILKTIAGYLKQLDGDVFFENTSLNKMTLNEKAKKLSVVLTEKISPELMTCRNVIETGRYPYTGRLGKLMPNDKAAVEKAIKMVEVTELSDKEFSKISDGQRQRVMLARAVCQEPQILILDEPTSYLDIYHKIHFLEILRKLADEEKIAVLVSIHELDFARKISDYVICVKNRKISHFGTPSEIFTDKIIKDLFNISDELFDKYFC